MAITKQQIIFLKELKKTAISLENEGKCLTFLIGELSACDYLNMKWKPSDGYDAISKKGELVQIKTRKSWSTQQVNGSGRLGKFGRKNGYQFHKGVYIELDHDFEVSGIWEMSVAKIRNLENKVPNGKALHVSDFRNNGSLLWSP